MKKTLHIYISDNLVKYIYTSKTFMTYVVGVDEYDDEKLEKNLYMAMFNLPNQWNDQDPCCVMDGKWNYGRPTSAENGSGIWCSERAYLGSRCRHTYNRRMDYRP